MKYSICTEMMYGKLDFTDRFKAAAADGFEYCEFWRWEGRDWNKIIDAVKKSGLKVSSFSGDDKYSLVDPEDSSSYLDFLGRSIEKAVSIGCPNLVIHTDALNPADGSAKKTKNYLSEGQKLINTYDTLKKCAVLAEKKGITLVLEPLNTLVDHKNYFLSDPDRSFELIEAVASKNIKLLFDIYHMQIMKGNIIERLQKNIEHVGYVHAADVPGRHEPGTGELSFENIFKALKVAGYDGFVGFELSPISDNKKAVDAIKKSMV
ncbi:MAG: TIM barrel protein [Spirochaetia bacterium]|jgi:hydroxypyruvate isomerase|nr:TIM barrel protein [Spirochaetia bacterium]